MMGTPTTYGAAGGRGVAALEHERVALLASARVLRRTHHSRAAVQLEDAAVAVADEIRRARAGGRAASRTCRLCGCTQDRACPGGCLWVSAPTGVDLCNRCAEVVNLDLLTAASDDLRAVLNPESLSR